MSLYSGFNALGIGGSANNVQQNAYQNRKSAYDQLANGLEAMFADQRRKEDEEKVNTSAFDYLVGRGYDEKKAKELVGSIGGRDIAQLALGQEFSDRVRDIENQNAIEGEKRAWEDWLKKNDITYGQGVKQSQFGQLMQNLALTKSKDWGNSRQGIEQYNSDVKAIKDFVAKNPEFADVLSVITLDNEAYGNEGYYDEDILDRIRGNEKRGIKGVIGDTAESESLLKDLMAHDKLNYIKENPLFRDAITQMLQNSDLKKLSPYITLEELNKGGVTAPQRKEQIVKAEAEKEYNSAVSELKKATGKENGKFPKMTKDQLKRAMKDKNLKWRVMAGVRAGAYKMEDVQ